jgi:hypothetical protein
LKRIGLKLDAILLSVLPLSLLFLLGFLPLVAADVGTEAAKLRILRLLLILLEVTEIVLPVLLPRNTIRLAG